MRFPSIDPIQGQVKSVAKLERGVERRHVNARFILVIGRGFDARPRAEFALIHPQRIAGQSQASANGGSITAGDIVLHCGTRYRTRSSTETNSLWRTPIAFFIQHEYYPEHEEIDD